MSSAFASTASTASTSTDHVSQVSISMLHQLTRHHLERDVELTNEINRLHARIVELNEERASARSLLRMIQERLLDQLRVSPQEFLASVRREGGNLNAPATAPVVTPPAQPTASPLLSHALRQLYISAISGDDRRFARSAPRAQGGSEMPATVETTATATVSTPSASNVNENVNVVRAENNNVGNNNDTAENNNAEEDDAVYSFEFAMVGDQMYLIQPPNRVSRETMNAELQGGGAGAGVGATVANVVLPLNDTNFNLSELFGGATTNQTMNFLDTVRQIVLGRLSELGRGAGAMRLTDDQLRTCFEAVRYGDLENPNYTMCPVYHEPFAETDTVYIVRNCRHAFSEQAYREWFEQRRNARCPVCRQSAVQSGVANTAETAETAETVREPLQAGAGTASRRRVQSSHRRDEEEAEHDAESVSEPCSDCDDRDEDSDDSDGDEY